MNTLQRDLRASTGDGAFYSVMVGMGETYLAAFALSLHASEIATGLLVAVPMLAGAILQLSSPPLIRRIGSHRKWVVGCAISQAISLMMLPLAIVCGRWGILVLFAAAALYWATGQATGPAWNTWIEELVPRELRARFFARRSRICQICVLAGFVVGGLFLDWGQRQAIPLIAFTVVLVVAACCRLASAWCLALHSEAPEQHRGTEQVSVGQVLKELRSNEGAKLCLYLFAVQIAVQISGPYFSPFMLAQLHFSYVQFMMLVSLGFVGKVVGLPFWGKLAHRYGATVLMWIGGLSIVPVSGMWLALPLFENPIPFLAMVQVAGGIAWAAYELAFFLMFFETIPRKERVSVLTLYNVGNALATAVGASLGALGLAILGETAPSYLLLFGISSVCRLMAIAFLARVPRMHVDVVVPALRILSLRSSDEASLDRPVLPTIPPRPETDLKLKRPAASEVAKPRRAAGSSVAGRL
ncbi:MAG: MFS transporter [Pirellulaceae bacterium]